MDTTLEELLKLAREDIARGSVTAAEKTLEQAVLSYNAVPEAFYLLGYVYSKKGKFKKAILSFQRALQLDPNHTDAAIALSSLYNDVGRYKDAASVFNHTKKRLDFSSPGHDPRINRDIAQKHFEMGLIYLRFERFKEAHHEFAKALNLDSSQASYSIQMAKTLSKMGDKNASVAVLRRALEAHPNHVEAKIQLGIVLHSLNQLREAEREWRDALSLAPENRSAQMYLSMLDYEPSV